MAHFFLKKKNIKITKIAFKHYKILVTKWSTQLPKSEIVQIRIWFYLNVSLNCCRRPTVFR